MVGFGPTNQTILQADLTSYLDTLHDILRKKRKRKGLRELIDSIQSFPAGWSHSVYLVQLSSAIQWHPALAEYGTSASPTHDVYLVSVPHPQWPASFKHWSLYSQGSFFHLVLHKDGIRLQVDPFTLEHAKSELESIDWQIRCDNVHRLNAHAASNGHVPMIAFGIGQTQFNLTQIEDLAHFVVSQFRGYTIQEKNCHLFALSLGTRVLMTKGAGTIFVGTRAQIAHWDLMATVGERPSPYTQADGFLLRAPSHELSNRSTRHWLNIPAVLADLGHTSDAMAIRRLYLYGPYSVGSFDPYGRHISKPFKRYVPYSTWKRLREASKIIVKAVEEFLQDVAHGDITNAVRGRRASNLRAYESVIINARKGDRIAQFLLPFHRRVLSITKEEDREAHIRLRNRETGVDDSQEVVENMRQ